MNARENNEFKENEDIAAERNGEQIFAAPLHTVTGGRLVFSTSVTGVTLIADAMLPDLAQVSFDRHRLNAWAKDGLVTVHSRRLSFLDYLLSVGKPARITLNASLPWEIEFSQSVSKLTADLHSLPLSSLDILGSASHVSLALAKPLRTTFIYIAGSADKVAIYRPFGVGVALQVQSGISRVAFDGEQFAVIGGETHFETAGFSDMQGRYKICIVGEARNVTIGHKR